MADAVDSRPEARPTREIGGRILRWVAWLVGGAVAALLLLYGYAAFAGWPDRAPAAAARTLGLLGFASRVDFGALGTFRVPLGLGGGASEWLTPRDLLLRCCDTTRARTADSTTTVAVAWGHEYGQFLDVSGKHAVGRVRVTVYTPAHRREALDDAVIPRRAATDSTPDVCAEPLEEARRAVGRRVVLACGACSPWSQLVAAAVDTARGVSVGWSRTATAGQQSRAPTHRARRCGSRGGARVPARPDGRASTAGPLSGSA